MKIWLRLTVLSSFVAVCWAQTPPVPASEPVSNSDLDGPLLYQLLLGELNVRLGSPGAGFSILLDAARKTRDPVLFQRAVDVALQSRSGDAALQAAQSWQREWPSAQEPARYMLQILLALNRLEEAGAALATSLANLPESEKSPAIASIPRVFARIQDKALAARVVETALSASLRQRSLQAAAWTTIGRMRQQAGQTEQAIDAAQQAYAADPAGPGPLLLALSLAENHSPRIERLLSDAMRGERSPELRMAYIRHLISAKAPQEAKNQLHMLIRQSPEFAQGWLLLGLIQIESGEVIAAQSHLQKFVEISRSHPQQDNAAGMTEALLALADLAQQQNRPDQAEQWLSQLPEGADPIRVAAARASFLDKRGQPQAALAAIENAQVRTPEQERRKQLMLSAWLRERRQPSAAHALIGKALALAPKDHELLLEQSLNAEKLGQFDEMEALLREVMAMRPEEAYAYNALGFSLADRGLRLGEARALLSKAVELAPQDAYIQDSLGWVKFRLGQLDEALRILRAAFAARPDAEIAAHLGEVLWALGQHDEARSVWQMGRKLKSDNETLVETLRRLGVSL